MNKIKIFKYIGNHFPSFIIPIKQRIIFESIPDLSDNTLPVFDEMIKRGLNNNYEMVWIIRKVDSNYPKKKNVLYVPYNNKIKRYYYQFTSKTLICCNAFLQAYRKGQTSIYLSHGLPIKAVKNYYTVPENIDYVLSPSKDAAVIMADQFNVDISKVISLGYPRNDVLISECIDLHKVFNVEGKIIIWLPTFRQLKGGLKHGSNALPIIYNQQIANQINDYAKSNNILIVIKPHFAQDMTYIKELSLSNIKIISDKFLSENNLSLYQMLSGSDALLTDYSSVYYDYTLCNKPIGVIWEDIEEYRKTPGFGVDLDYYLKGAEKIYNKDDFCVFLDHVAKNIDILNFDRNEIKQKVTFTDGMSAKRVVDFIETLL